MNRKLQEVGCALLRDPGFIHLPISWAPRPQNNRIWTVHTYYLSYFHEPGIMIPFHRFEERGRRGATLGTTSRGPVFPPGGPQVRYLFPTMPSLGCSRGKPVATWAAMTKIHSQCPANLERVLREAPKIPLPSACSELPVQLGTVEVGGAATRGEGGT